MVIIALIAADVGLGLGRHWSVVPHDHFAPMVQVTLAVDMLYIWSLVWSKLSLLLLYYRVFRFGYFKRACYAAGALVGAWAVVSTVLLFILCVPLYKYWDKTVEGHCSDPAPVRLFNSIATIITDVLILCLPLPQIWRLQGLRMVDRIGLSVLFALGFLSVALAPVLL